MLSGLMPNWSMALAELSDINPRLSPRIQRPVSSTKSIRMASTSVGLLVLRPNRPTSLAYAT